jgi:hypothetical protein
MYTTVTDSIQKIRETALSHEYTQAAVSQYETYKQQLGELHAATEKRIAEHREALLAAVQGRRTDAVEAFRERRDRVFEQLDGAKGAVVERAEQARAAAYTVVAAPVERATELVSSTRAAVADAIAPHQEKIEKATNMAVAAAAFAIAYLLAFWHTVLSVLCVHVPKAVAVGDSAIETVKPYGEKALALCATVDTRFGGFVSHAVLRVLDESKQVRMVDAPRQPPLGLPPDHRIPQLILDPGPDPPSFVTPDGTVGVPLAPVPDFQC